MSNSPVIERSYRVARDGRSVVCDASIGRDSLVALSDALAWQRHRISTTDMQSVDEVLALRAVVALEDRVGAAMVGEDVRPLELDCEYAQLLCNVARSYVAERDFEGFRALEERKRIGLLSALSGPLMDTCCELATAAEEAIEKELLVG